MVLENIVVKGAREHNLKNVNVTIPRDKLVVITGLSGSGKSSLAFDTIYAEGQRRYVESLSAYARQFLGQSNKPDVDAIEGLSPAISIDQKTTSHNPRSTVGTVTEIYDYLRLLFARVGHPFCPNDGTEITSQTVEQMVDRVLAFPERTRVQIMAPLIAGRKGTQAKVLEDIKKQGYVRVRVDGDVYALEEVPALEKNKKHTIDVMIDRIVVKPDIGNRLSDSLETALKIGDGRAIVAVVDGEELLFSEKHACPVCGFSIGELEPRLFSFNSPFGACADCDGLGSRMEVDLDLVLPDRSLSLADGAVAPWEPTSSQYYPQLLRCACATFGVDMNVPVSELPKDKLDIVLYGAGSRRIHFHYENDFGETHDKEMPFEGVVANVARRYRETSSDFIREQMTQYMMQKPCPTCHGDRLRPEALAVKVGGKAISEVTALPIRSMLEFFNRVALSEKEQIIARLILREIKQRTSFLIDVGLDYLTLGRAAGTLSGGEAQRIRLATQIGSQLMGVLYILDEPSIGLHQRDNDRLIHALKRMRDLGNTLLVVEHDEDTMLAADCIIDVGPGAGEHGGRITAQGTPAQLMDDPHSLTGQYLSGKKFIPLPPARRPLTKRAIKLSGARANNLKNVNVSFPLGIMTVVTGVSGSGKSTLVNEILFKALAQKLNGRREAPGAFRTLRGMEYIDSVIQIDQSPIGRTPRSNPATYTGVFDMIRDVFAATNEAKVRGYKKGRFSFNVKGGRCEACSGDGIIKIEMHFLPDVYVPCEVCHGKRYNRETLDIMYKGKTIADVLDMTVEEALEFFTNVPRIKRRLEPLFDVGLGYVRLGQAATTLSGGEAQRVKLAAQLYRRTKSHALYILDEPTTGLHIDDIARLLRVLQALVDNGNSVLIIEHNLDVIKCADYLIDLGPEGGDGGGTIVAAGTPEEIAATPASYTGRYLKPILERDRRRAGAHQAAQIDAAEHAGSGL
ncbi:MAG: excinuclease ABC subunit UvrA [Sporolactobacillus sp.]